MSYYDDFIDGDWRPVKVPYKCPKCGRRITASLRFPMPEIRCLAPVKREGVRQKGETRKVPCNEIMLRDDPKETGK